MTTAWWTPPIDAPPSQVRGRLRTLVSLTLTVLSVACRDATGPGGPGQRPLFDGQWGWVPGSSSLLSLEGAEGPIRVLDVASGESRTIVPASGGAWSYGLSMRRVQATSGFVYFSGWARATDTGWLLRAAVRGGTAADTLARMALFQGMLNALPTPSPDGRLVAWTSVTGPAAFLATLDLQTGERRQYPAPMVGECPTFSPDGTSLVAASDQPGPTVAWWVDLTTSAVRTTPLSTGVDLCTGENVDWDAGAPVIYGLLGTTLTRYDLGGGGARVVGHPPVPTGYTAYPAVRVDAVNHAVTWWQHVCTKEHSSFLGTSCVRAGQSLHVFDWRTGASRELLHFETNGGQYDPDPVGQGVIAPDGRWVAYRCYNCPTPGVYLARVQ